MPWYSLVEYEHVQYDRQQLQSEVYEGMWKLATHVIKYYDVKSADAGKIHDKLYFGLHINCS